MGLTEEYIDRISKALASNNSNEAASLVKETVSVFSAVIPGIKTGLDRYRSRVSTIGPQSTYDNYGDLQKLLGKLRLYLEQTQRVNSSVGNERYFCNVIVRNTPDYVMPSDRMLEDTPDEIRAIFSSNGQYDLQALSKLPTIITNEFKPDDTITVADIGYIDAPSLAPKITHPVIRIPSLQLVRTGLLTGWGGERTRWTVREANPFKLFAEHVISNNTVKSPTVDNKLIAVMMPFTTEAALDNVYQAIVKGAEEVGFQCRRVDEINTPATITDDVRSLIHEARIVVADISGKNANVMFELGFANGCEKDTIIISSDNYDSLPFDVRQQRIIKYAETSSGLQELSERLSSFLDNI